MADLLQNYANKLEAENRQLEAQIRELAAERDMAIEAMKEWKGRAMIAAKQVRDMALVPVQEETDRG